MIIDVMHDQNEGSRPIWTNFSPKPGFQRIARMFPIFSKTWEDWKSSGVFIIGFFRSLLWARLLMESFSLLKEISVLSV